MRVRYWRGGELEREEVVEAGPRVCAELPKVLVRPFQVQAGEGAGGGRAWLG